MADYGFAEELLLIGDGKPLPLSFFNKMEALANNNACRYPPHLIRSTWRQWDRAKYRDVARGFIADYLFEEGNERIRFFLSAGECYFPDGLMVRMFHQYITALMARRNPVGLNLIRRIKYKLEELTKERRIESMNRNHTPAYRRKGDGNESFADEAALEIAAPSLPNWRQVRYKAGSKKIDPVIGNEDLIDQILGVFRAVPGWISLDVLRDFLLLRFNGNLPFREVCLEDISPLSIGWSGIGEAPEMKIRVRDIMERRLTERQRAIFIHHYLEGRGVSEIVALMGLKKSTVYNEISSIRDIFESNLRHRTVCPVRKTASAHYGLTLT